MINKIFHFKHYKMQKMWWLGFLSLLGVPNFMNLIRGVSYSYYPFFAFLSLLWFLPYKSDQRSQISSDEIEYYRLNPDKISLITSESRIRYRYLTYVFFLGLVFVIVSKLIFPILNHSLNMFWIEIIKDLLFELGVALWGGTATAYIIEVHSLKEEKESKNKQQYIRNILAIGQNSVDDDQL